MTTAGQTTGTNRIRRALFSRKGLVLAVLGVALAGALPLASRWQGEDADSGPLMHKVQKGDFFHDITERGELESASNVEIRCEVKSRNTAGTTIIELVPEGSLVKPGDVICKLDSTALENDRTTEQISVSNAEAEVIRSRTLLANAILAKEEYLKGTYVQNEKSISAELAVAKEDLRRAEEYLEYSKILKSKGYITGTQLQGDMFAVEKARNSLAAVEKKFEALQRYTLKKMERQLTTDIEVAEARLKADEHALSLEKGKLEEVEKQIERCTIKAPSPGQVVYANVTSTWGGREIIIEAGSTVRERQEIVRLPDHTKMQVRAKVNEANVAMVMVGMPATVRLDAMPDRTFRAEVARVSEYPAPTNRFTSSVKEYETLVRVLDPPPGCRPGLTAEVKIHIEQLSDVVQVPVQAVIEQAGQHFVVVRDGDGLRVQEVKLGSTNDKFVVVREGLAEEQEVVLNSGAVRSRVSLPEVAAEHPPIHATAKQRGAGGPRHMAKAASHSQPTAKEEPRTDGREANASEPAATPEQLFARLDRNGNGKLEAGELPDQFRSYLKTRDRNHDGAISLAEWTALVAKLGTPVRHERQSTRAGL
jgi:multidrug resistance efflux pump